MADTYETLTDIGKVNDENLADVEITDLLDDAPLLAALAAETASDGDKHKYPKETGAPVVGFRDINAGIEHSVSGDEIVTIDLKVLDASTRTDVAAASIWKKGGPLAYVARKNRRSLKSAFATAEKQIIYGTGNKSDGFVGLADAETLDDLDDPMVVDAGGTTADTASSVYLIRTNDEGTDCTLITGMEGNITIGETSTQEVDDADGKHYHAYVTAILAWLGLQIGSIHSVGRIVNLTEDDGKGLTDDLIYKGLEKFPSSKQPNLIVMNRRSLRQLRESRTATNPSGTPAARPTEVDGIPIICTDSIINTEALLAAEE
ncbi:major capsid protein [Gimesia algae]|uniref:Major capsid protein n=1 Tax=Gimesia algae TaxID=2527971 RepID=A0A517VMD1_9PLAN|nr:hypothetical protein [Gimesia algae]QDT94168.1 hypothetical protein Pan161_58610 [Gimesia algae]